MTSDETFPQQLTQIDELMLPDHVYLDDEATCYFLGEYTARVGYGYSDTNQLIFNFKKPMDRRDRPAEWRHKGIAIRRVARAFSRALNPAFVDYATFVPVPPSKSQERF